jgi:dynein intermediate chain 2
MNHKVGGWPREYDPEEPAEVAKYQKKLLRDPILQYANATRDLVQNSEKSIKQNNEIDLFEEYFAGEQPEHMSESISTKTVMIFKDPNNIKRAANKIVWHPDPVEQRVGVSYAQLRFQQMPPNMPKKSYIWNLNNPNFPEKTLEGQSPLCTMAFNHKLADIIVAGQYNGALSFFDLRRGHSSGVIKPTDTTVLEKSHHDPVYGTSWFTPQKQGSECMSTSTDGRLIWWDMKKLSEPIEVLMLTDSAQTKDGPAPKILGGTCLDYNQDAAPNKYMVGTEQGYIIQAQRRKQAEVSARFAMEGGRHHGPVYSMQRNPAHLKYFLTIGDWSAKIWSEEIKSPIMQTRYHNSYLTDGCWSPTRPGIFYLTRMDGFLDVWDIFYRQNEIAYSQKISDAVLTSISVKGGMAAIGDSDGTVSMMSLCRALWDHTLQPKEKEVMQQIFEREFRREKNLDVARKAAERAGPPKKKDDKQKDKIAERLEAKLKEIESKFFEQFPVDEDDQQVAAAKEEPAEPKAE